MVSVGSTYQTFSKSRGLLNSKFTMISLTIIFICLTYFNSFSSVSDQVSSYQGAHGILATQEWVSRPRDDSILATPEWVCRPRDDSILATPEWVSRPEDGSILATPEWVSRPRDDSILATPEWVCRPEDGSILATPEWVSRPRDDSILATPEWVCRPRDGSILATPEWVCRPEDGSILATPEWVCRPEDGSILATPEWVCRPEDGSILATPEWVSNQAQTTIWFYCQAQTKYHASNITLCICYHDKSRTRTDYNAIYYADIIVTNQTVWSQSNTLYHQYTNQSLHHVVYHYNYIFTRGVFWIFTRLRYHLMSMIELYVDIMLTLFDCGRYYHNSTTIARKCLLTKLKLIQHMLRQHDFKAYVKSIGHGIAIANGVALIIVSIFVCYKNLQYFFVMPWVMRILTVSREASKFGRLFVMLYLQSWIAMHHQFVNIWESFTSCNQDILSHKLIDNNRSYIGGGRANEFSYHELKPYAVSDKAFETSAIF